MSSPLAHRCGASGATKTWLAPRSILLRGPVITWWVKRSRSTAGSRTRTLRRGLVEDARQAATASAFSITINRCWDRGANHSAASNRRHQVHLAVGPDRRKPRVLKNLAVDGDGIALGQMGSELGKLFAERAQ